MLRNGLNSPTGQDFDSFRLWVEEQLSRCVTHISGDIVSQYAPGHYDIDSRNNGYSGFNGLSGGGGTSVTPSNITVDGDNTWITVSYDEPTETYTVSHAGPDSANTSTQTFNSFNGLSTSTDSTLISYDWALVYDSHGHLVDASGITAGTTLRLYTTDAWVTSNHISGSSSVEIEFTHGDPQTITSTVGVTAGTGLTGGTSSLVGFDEKGHQASAGNAVISHGPAGSATGTVTIAAGANMSGGGSFSFDSFGHVTGGTTITLNANPQPQLPSGTNVITSVTCSGDTLTVTSIAAS